jgi:CRISPR-associated protein Csy3
LWSANNVKNSIIDPYVLNYARSLHPTRASFYACVGDDRQPLTVAQETLLGVRADPMTGSAEGDYAAGNPQRVDKAALPVGCSTLEISYGLTASPSSLRPHACDSPSYRHAIVAFADAYRKAGGFAELAKRYAINIANGRAYWRNRLLADSCLITVRIGDAALEFDAFDPAFDLNKLKSPEKYAKAIDAVAKHIRAGLEGPRVTRLRVVARLGLGEEGTVWPSQEFVDNDNRNGSKSDRESGRVFYRFVNGAEPNATGYHEQKIGAAIRCIDTWHNGHAEGGVSTGKALCVNPYGQDREAYVVVREPRAGGSKDFYTLLRERIDNPPSKPTPEDHFIMANLVRGGVFPLSGKKSKAQAALAEVAE